MSDEIYDEGTVRFTGRAPALRPSVPLYRHMLYGSGLGHPLDFVVLMHIHFMCEDGKNFTVQDLIDELRREGVRNANGKGDGLVGSKAVYESIARLRAAGFVHRSQDNGGNFGKVAYTFHEFPAADPNWTPPAVSESAGNLPLPLTGEAVPNGNDIAAGHAASPHRGSADRGSADRRSGKRGVAAGHAASPHRGSGDVSPPHPPEEEDSSSPYPLTRTKDGVPSQRGEGAEFAPEQLRAAEGFLQQMQRWQAGGATARKHAPRLLRVMRTQGWPTLEDLDEDQHLLLEAEIFRNTVGAKSWTKCLPGWIDDLRLYSRAQSRLVSGQGAGGRERCPDHPSRYRIGCLDCAMAVPS